MKVKPSFCTAAGLESSHRHSVDSEPPITTET